MPNPTVIVQNWEESERGWGTRPNGFTVHISHAQHQLYVAWYYATFNNCARTPEAYTRVAGDSLEIEVPHAVFSAIAAKSTTWIGEGDAKHFTNAVRGKANHWQSGKLLTLEHLQL